MHRLPSSNAITRFRLSAYLYVLGLIMIVGSISFLAYALFFNHKQHLILATGLVGASVLVFVFQWITSARARCPLCLVPSMAKKNCSKNRKAEKLLGSYRLKVASSIILHNHFRCPYCNEPTVLEVRQRKIPQ